MFLLQCCEANGFVVGFLYSFTDGVGDPYRSRLM